MSKENETNHWDTIAEQQLDQELAKWAAEEIEVPTGFHATVMQRLREETSVTSCAAGEENVVSLSNKKLNKKSNKKWWTPAVAAAALVLCCLPVLHQLPHNLPEEASSQVQEYSLAKNRAVTSDIAAEKTANTNDGIMMAAIEPEASAPVGVAYDAEVESVAEDAVPLTQQLQNATERAEALEQQLAQLAQDNATEAQRKALEEELQNIYDEIAQLEAQMKEE